MTQTIKTNRTQNHEPRKRFESYSIEKLHKNIALLYGIKNTAEIELLATLFIEQLADNLELLAKPAKIASGKNSIFFPVSYLPKLPSNFPDGAEMPLYLYGDRVCDRSLYVINYHTMSSQSNKS